MAERSVPGVNNRGFPAGRIALPEDSSVIEVLELSKAFPGVRALDSVSVDVRAGEIHCWVGENGAGKSTLIKILAGAQKPDAGCIRIGGREIELSEPTDAMHEGLSFIFQELSVVDGLSIADNIMLGNEFHRGPTVLRSASSFRAAEMLARIGFDHLEPSRMVGELSTAEKQAVMIARALNLDANVIFLDETTATLDSGEVQRLFDVMRKLRDDGKSVVFVTHRLQEVIEVADRVTVFKDGTTVSTLSGSDIKVETMVRSMVGREISSLFPAKGRAPGDVILSAQDVATVGVHGINLKIRAGEVLGISGLVGSGRTELLRSLFGVDRVRRGSLRIDGKEVVVASPRAAISLGIALVPEDRRSQGIIALRSVEENLTLTWAQTAGWRNWRKRAVKLAQRMVEELSIRTPSIRQQMGLLSGGNQQKVIVARWLAARPRVLLLDEPTRGIDVGAKSEIYRLIDQLARDGLAVVVVSSDLLEILGLADRIAVMRDGTIAGELPGDSTEGDVVLLAMTHGEAKYE
jgi:ABC-type sugar transport system ATPase subunit